MVYSRNYMGGIAYLSVEKTLNFLGRILYELKKSTCKKLEVTLLSVPGFLKWTLTSYMAANVLNMLKSVNFDLIIYSGEKFYFS